MGNERLNIPKTLKVGFQNRKDTYSGKLAYVTYINKDGDIAKLKSWEGWRDKNIDIETYHNIPIDGFVLNRRVGGYKSGWNYRNTACRVYDPRGFEVEISVENLLFILQECTSTKGKGLEGKFVYSWSGSELILLPVECEDYKQSMELLSKQEKITKKDLKIGASYKAKDRDYLIYIGKMEWFIWERVYKELPNKNGWGTYISEKWDEATRVLMPTFIDINKNEFVGCNNMKNLDFLIEENVISPDEVESYVDNYKTTPAYRTQFINELTLNKNLSKWESFKNDFNKHYASLYLKYPDSNSFLEYEVCKDIKYNGETLNSFLYKKSYKDENEKNELIDFFKLNADIKYSFRKQRSFNLNGNKLMQINYYTNFDNKSETIEGEDWKYISDNISFSSKNGDEPIDFWISKYDKRYTIIPFNQDNL